MHVNRTVLLASIVLLLFGQTGCTTSNTATSGVQPGIDRAIALDELRAAIDTFYNAYYNKDWDLYYTFYADDAVLIDRTGDTMNLKEYEARAAKEAETLGDLVKESVEDLPVDVRLSPNGQSGIAYSRFPYEYRNADGKESILIIAETDVWWKIDGDWKVVHIHFPEVQKEE